MLYRPVKPQSGLEEASSSSTFSTKVPQAMPSSQTLVRHTKVVTSRKVEDHNLTDKTDSASLHAMSTNQRQPVADCSGFQLDEGLISSMQALNVKPLLPHQIQNTAHIQSGNSSQSNSEFWSFKKKILASRGIEAEFSKPKTPTSNYLSIASEPSVLLCNEEILNKRPKLLVLDLNQTLLVRKRSTSKASKNATPRPYLSAFWEYICGYDEIKPGLFQRRFNVMVSFSFSHVCRADTYIPESAY